VAVRVIETEGLVVGEGAQRGARRIFGADRADVQDLGTEPVVEAGQLCEVMRYSVLSDALSVWSICPSQGTSSQVRGHLIA